MIPANLKAFQLWVQCASVACGKCKVAHNGRLFATIRICVPTGNLHEYKLSPEVYLVQLCDLDKLGGGMRLTEVKNPCPFMRARWNVENEDYMVANAGTRGGPKSLQPKIRERYTVYVTAISPCKCRLLSEAEEGNLGGVHGDSALLLVSGSDTNTSDNDDVDGEGAQDSYFIKQTRVIEEDFVKDASTNEDYPTQVLDSKKVFFICPFQFTF